MDPCSTRSPTLSSQVLRVYNSLFTLLGYSVLYLSDFVMRGRMWFYARRFDQHGWLECRPACFDWERHAGTAQSNEQRYLHFPADIYPINICCRQLPPPVPTFQPPKKRVNMLNHLNIGYDDMLAAFESRYNEVAREFELSCAAGGRALLYSSLAWRCWHGRESGSSQVLRLPLLK